MAFSRRSRRGRQRGTGLECRGYCDRGQVGVVGQHQCADVLQFGLFVDFEIQILGWHAFKFDFVGAWRGVEEPGIGEGGSREDLLEIAEAPAELV